MENKNKNRTALVTGSAGFIGFHIARKLLEEGYRVVGVDNHSQYYDVALKKSREAILSKSKKFMAVCEDIEKRGLLLSILKEERPSLVIHLAAQAGVRYSIEQPRSYLKSNILGTFELLEASKKYPPAHSLIASTSSVYGSDKNYPYKEIGKADNPLSFYAATKKSIESIAHSYSHLFDLPITIFRFFTVYGPWGRPDMALFKFTKSILEDIPIDVYNHGKLKRDFTYIDDLIKSIWLLSSKIPTNTIQEVDNYSDSLSENAPYRIVNIGNSRPVELLKFIEAIESALGKRAKKNFMPMQPGDVPITWANVELLNDLIGFVPDTDVNIGVKNFVKWYKKFYI